MKVQAGSSRVTVTVIAAAILLLGGGVAYAYWTASGSGTGLATTSTSESFVIDSGDATGEPLTPGGPPQTVPFTVTNPGSGIQNLSGVAVTVANSDGTPWTAVPGCSAEDYSLTTTIAPGQIAPGASVAGTVTIAMNNLPRNQDACKDVPVPLYFLAS